MALFDDGKEPQQELLADNKKTSVVSDEEIQQLHVEHKEVLSYSIKIGMYWIVISTAQWFFFCCRWYVWVLYARNLGQHNSVVLAFSVYSVYFIQAFSNLLWGWIADKYTYDIIGCILAFFVVIGLVMESFAFNYNILLIGTIIVDIFRAHQTIAIAFLAKYLPNFYAIKYQSYRFALIGISNLVGPILGGVLTDYLGIRSSFYFSSIIAFISLLVLIFIINGTQNDIHLKQSKLKTLYNNNNATNIDLYSFEGDDLLNVDYQFPILTQKYIREQEKDAPNINVFNSIPKLSPHEWFMLINILISNSATLSIEASIATYIVVFGLDSYNVPVTLTTLMVVASAFCFIVTCVSIPLLVSKYKSRQNIPSNKFDLEFISCIIVASFMILFCMFMRNFLHLFNYYWFWAYSIFSGLALGSLNILTEIVLLTIQPKQHSGKIGGVKNFFRSLTAGIITFIIGSLWSVDIYWFFYVQAIFYGIVVLCNISLMIYTNVYNHV